ncbi:unnamed protein product [Zymoseptoria tritici ST99CH_3D7]|uniref:Uncharacterized protein n=1 Tax=Zymoseptoria tritici (strain ST99CH_3D7) TaxID=1276538 RepID=A0A1X7RLX2_ZYMT9|nr:unnamed protein product [Zymoseptoria tritici ST99CH_3D7]
MWRLHWSAGGGNADARCCEMEYWRGFDGRIFDIIDEMSIIRIFSGPVPSSDMSKQLIHLRHHEKIKT